MTAAEVKEKVEVEADENPIYCLMRLQLVDGATNIEQTQPRFIDWFNHETDAIARAGEEAERLIKHLRGPVGKVNVRSSKNRIVITKYREDLQVRQQFMFFVQKV